MTQIFETIEIVYDNAEHPAQFIPVCQVLKLVPHTQTIAENISS